MSELNNAPELQNTAAAQAEQLPVRSLEDISAEQSQAGEVIEEIHQKEATETQSDFTARCEIFVVENDFLGLEPRDTEQMVRALIACQKDFGTDIDILSEFSHEDLKEIISKDLNLGNEKNETKKNLGLCHVNRTSRYFLWVRS